MHRRYMKNLILLFSIVLFISLEVNAACSVPISRTNFSPNTVLTSTELNNQFNTVYNQANDLDGDCITDGTLGGSALDSTTTKVLTDSPFNGCKISYSDSNTISVGACQAAVGGNFVQTTIATTVTWLCSGCSAEAADTVYYIYAASSSDGTTLDLKILTTAPDDFGYNSGDRVLGSFVNDSSSDIGEDSVATWDGNSIKRDFRYEVKTLSSDINNTSAPIADLQFNNLVVGRKYRVTINGHLQIINTSNATVSITAKHDGSSISVQAVGTGGSGGVDDATAIQSKVFFFDATATTLTFDSQTAASGYIRGDGTEIETHVILEEVPDNFVNTGDF